MNIPQNNRTAIWSRPALWLLFIGITGTLVFAVLLTLKTLERKRDTEYYNSMSASFFTEEPAPTPVITDAASADTVSVDAEPD